MKLTSVLAGLCLFLASLNAQAVAIFFDPAAQVVNVGAQVTVDVVIEDLGDFASPSLSTFDLDVLFDDSLLGFDSVIFGTALDQGGGSIAVDVAIAGGHNFFEVSFDSSADLIAGQPASFVLFSVTFNTLTAGTAGLTLNINDLGDEQFPPAFIPADTRAGSVQIDAVPVPEPGPLSLMALGLLALGAARSRQAI